MGMKTKTECINLIDTIISAFIRVKEHINDDKYDDAVRIVSHIAIAFNTLGGVLLSVCASQHEHGPKPKSAYSN